MDRVKYFRELFSASMEVYGAIFFLSINTFMANLFNTILVFQSERAVFLREQANQMYGVFAYFMAKTVMDMPVIIVAPLMCTIIFYFGIGLE